MAYRDKADESANKKKYYAANKARIAAYRKAYYQREWTKVRASQKEAWVKKGKQYKAARKTHRLASIYKTTPETIERLLAVPVCMICRYRPARDIDHCHRTGRVRGRLCRHCNVGLGHFDDNPDLFFRAADYLLNHGGMDGI